MSTEQEPTPHITLEHPEFAADAVGGATFERYANALSTRHVAWLAVLFALGNVLFWPTDWLFIERGSRLAESAVPMRIGFIIIAVALFLVLRYVRALRRHVTWILVGSIALGYVVTALTVVRTWSPSESTTLAWIHTGYLMPLLTMALVVTLRRRIVATFALPVLEIGIFYLVKPEVVMSELIGVPLVVWTFVCITSTAVGEALFRLLRINFDQRRSLAERADELEKRREGLQNMVDWLNSLNKTLSHEVQTKAGDLNRMLDRVHKAREHERRQISYDLDEELGRQILDLRTQLVGYRRRFQASQEVAQALTGLDSSLTGTLTTVNALIEELRPELVAQKGFLPAVFDSIDAAGKRTSATIRLSIVPESFELPKPESETIFRVFQEILKNAVQHSQASDINVTITYSPGQLALRVADNGRGLSEEDRRLGGRGLKAIQEQSDSLRGKLSIESGSNQGTRVELKIPVVATVHQK